MRRLDGELDKISAQTAGEAMTAPALTVRPTQQVSEVARLMVDNGINRLPVVARGRLVGIVSRADLVRAFTRTDEEIEQEIRRDVLLGVMLLAPDEFEVAVENGCVRLHGRVAAAEDAAILTRCVRRVPGVVDLEADLAWHDDRAHRHAGPSGRKHALSPAPAPASSGRLDELAAADPEAAFRLLESSPLGLDGPTADARRLALGANELAEAGSPLAALVLAQLRSPLIGLLVAAAAVATAVGERVNGAIILTIVASSLGLGVFNEYGSRQTLAALRRRTGRRATVLRGGAPEECPASVLVPGDVCLLQAGDVVPADLRLFDVSELTVDESMLTGEAYPAQKAVAPSLDGGALHANCAYAGTIVRGGRGVGVVVATGADTRLGDVAGALREHQPPTAFQRGLTGFALLLAKVTAALTIVIFAVNTTLGRPVLDALLFSLAIAVGLTPQLLPAIVTVSLSTGARRMAKKSVLVKRLVSIEDLGDADLLFTDKTGTLTEGEIRLREAVDPAGAAAPALTRLGLLCSELSFEHGDTPLGNTLDLAIWHGLEPAVARAELATARRVSTAPFTFERRRMSVVLDDAGRRRLLCKGAAEEVLSRCTPESRGAADATLARLLDSGHRVLALAEKTLAAEDVHGEEDEDGLTLLGFLVFADPPKADAAASVARLAASRHRAQGAHGRQRAHRGRTSAVRSAWR